MKIHLQKTLKIVALFFIVFCSFDAFGQVQAYAIKRGEIWSGKQGHGKYYEPNKIFLLISDHNKVIIVLNSEGSKTNTFDVEKITLDGKSGLITYSCTFFNGNDYQSATVLHSRQERKITIKDYPDRAFQYYY